jgi:hypothetical protein
VSFVVEKYMNKTLIVAFVVAALALPGYSAGKGPDIRIIDDKVSMQADAVPLARLLRLLDQVTGMTSKVPAELENRNVSVRFTNLSFDEAVQKIFEGLPLDYAVIQGQGIVVTGTSQPATAANTGPAPFTPPAPQPQESFADDNPSFMPAQVPFQNQNPNQPGMIQTPFGARPNPNLPQNQIQQQQQVAQPQQVPQQPVNTGLAPLGGPGQVNNPFNGNGIFGTLPGTNTAQPGMGIQQAPPFGANPAFPQQAPVITPTPAPIYPPQQRPIP